MLKFGDELFDMIVKSETHATFQNFSKDGKQRNRFIIFGWDLGNRYRDLA
jgi:hypothetical protein